MACSVTVVTGRTPCAVRDAHSSFVAKTDIREKATVQVVCFANGRPVPARRDSHHTQMLRIHLFLSHTALCASVIAYEIKNNLKVLFRLCVVDGQDSLISGAEMLAFESGACSVTEGHRAHNVCGAERTFEPVADTNSKRKSATAQAVCKANDRPVSPNGSRTTRKCCALSCLLFPATLCASTIERKTKNNLKSLSGCVWWMGRTRSSAERKCWHLRAERAV